MDGMESIFFFSHRLKFSPVPKFIVQEHEVYRGPTSSDFMCSCCRTFCAKNCSNSHPFIVESISWVLPHAFGCIFPHLLDWHINEINLWAIHYILLLEMNMKIQSQYEVLSKRDISMLCVW